MAQAPYLPAAVYAGEPHNQPTPRVMLAPPKYIQGAGVLEQIGRYLGIYEFKHVAILASARGHGAQAAQIIAQVSAAGCEAVAAVFTGECSLPEIEARAAELETAAVECLIAVGGGKCVDAGKCVAHRLRVPLVVVPTLASNDAPTSAVSVLYTPEGAASGAEFFPHNPIMVVVDTRVIADAGERYLVAGMGDAMATWYEAKVCIENPDARTVLGAQPTLAACAIGETCAATLFTLGLDAAAAVRENRVDDALESVVEANTLLSGVGFESGGLAAAHGFAQGYSTLPEVERNYLHGEMVAMGLVAQLMMQDEPAEARRVAEFFAVIGLPVHLGQIGLDASQHAQIDAVVDGALAFAPIHNLPFPVNADVVNAGLLAADELGRTVADEMGEAAYQRLHG